MSNCIHFVWLLLFLSCIIAAAQETTVLSNDQDFPLVGMGVGNLAHESIVDMISHGIKEGIRLIDTARASHNEHLVTNAVASTNEVIHVVTKVWYTHLGYERTKLSVHESLKELNLTNIRVHVLLHWPRCRNEIAWMDCEGEEERLPQYVKDAGPPPDHDSFVDSWRALEELYEENERITSIGVSNFEMSDLQLLLGHCRIVPHLFQGNVWKVVFDPRMMTLLQKHHVHFQAYNVMNGIVSRFSEYPNAHHSLERVSEELSPAQVVLCWLIQQDISIIPRTSNLHHLAENVAIQNAPTLAQTQNESIRKAVMSLLKGMDLEPPKATFYNKGDSNNIHLYWTSHSGEEVSVKQDLQPGESYQASTFPGHVFVAYDDSKSQRLEFQVTADFGNEEHFHIDEL